METPQQRRWQPLMRQALQLAQAELAQGSADVPVGALVVDAGGEVIAAATNTREQRHDPAGHAEVTALRAAAEQRQAWRLTGCTLVVTLEPCIMCAGALVAARVERVVFGAFDTKAGAVGSVWELVRDRQLTHHPEVVAGVLEDECAGVLRKFFATRRASGDS